MNSGAYWSLMPVIAAELFGEVSIGAIYNYLGLAPASASFVVTIGIADVVYSAHTPAHAPALCARTVGMKDGKCFGMACYQTTFIVTTGLCALGCLLALLLTRRMVPFYAKRDHARAGAP